MPPTISQSPQRPRPSARIARRIPSFWICQLTRREVATLSLSAVLAVTMHLAPVLHSFLGNVLVYVLAAISLTTPVSGFFFIACSQFLPFPEGSFHNPAQAGVLVWIPVAFLAYHRLSLKQAWLIWPIFPFLAWTILLTGEAVYLPSSEWSKAIAYSIMACQLVNESRGQLLKCLFGLCLGSLVVMTAYWALQVGLPIEIQDWGGEREGFARMGGVRADAVMVWPALLLGISGLLGIQITYASRYSPVSSPKWLTTLTVGLCVLSMPPLVSTMSHGAFAGLALVILAILWAGWLVGRGGAMKNPRFRQMIKWSLVGVAAVGLLFAVDAFQLRTKVFSMQEYYMATKGQSGAAASRSGVWTDSINTILSYPVFGIKTTGDREVITSEYAEQGYYLSHNIFLDFGRTVGIPGMLLLAFFFFWPAWHVITRGSTLVFIPFLLAHFSMLIFWMSLSFTFYKTFWALWMLMAMAAVRVTAARRLPVSRSATLPRPAAR